MKLKWENALTERQFGFDWLHHLAWLTGSHLILSDDTEVILVSFKQPRRFESAKKIRVAAISVFLPSKEGLGNLFAVVNREQRLTDGRQLGFVFHQERVSKLTEWQWHLRQRCRCSLCVWSRVSRSRIRAAECRRRSPAGPRRWRCIPDSSPPPAGSSPALVYLKTRHSVKIWPHPLRHDQLVNLPCTACLVLVPDNLDPCKCRKSLLPNANAEWALLCSSEDKTFS